MYEKLLVEVNNTCRKMTHAGMVDKSFTVLKKCRSPLGEL
jgi:hypothetical protein